MGYRMDPVCLIRQPAGIGDIFFTQKIAKVIQASTQYKHVVWPVAEVYSYISDYMGEYEIDFPVESSDFPHKDVYLEDPYNVVQNDDVLYVPLQRANYAAGCSCHGNPIAHGHMKYDMLGIDYSDWLDYFEFNRDYDREAALKDRLGLDGEYMLVNRKYATGGIGERTDLPVESDMRIVEMEILDGTHLFDWIGVAEDAAEVHIVEGAMCYLMEKIGIDGAFVYSRHRWTNDDFSYMKGNFHSKWTYIS
jgi:hypothetical protein